VAQAARELAAGAGRGVDNRLLRLVADVPGQNRPRLTVEAVLPDGRRLTSAVREGPYFNLDASLVVMANGFDRRRLTLRVMHQPPGGAPEKVGEVTVTVGELIGRPTGSVSTPPVLAMELQVAPAEGAQEGPGRGFSLAQDGARPPPPPRPRRRPRRSRRGAPPGCLVAGSPGPVHNPLLAPATSRAARRRGPCGCGWRTC